MFMKNFTFVDVYFFLKFLILKLGGKILGFIGREFSEERTEPA